MLPIAAAVIFILWLLTILLSDAPWTIVTGFWAGIGAWIAFSARRSQLKDQSHTDAYARGLTSAIARNEAEVFDVKAVAFLEFEEFEDEGAAYAFDLGDGRIAFIQGQQFYEGARFPSLDFSLVHALDEQGGTADMWIEKRGRRVPPSRVIPAAVKHTLNVPDHLTIRYGRLDDLEIALRADPGM